MATSSHRAGEGPVLVPLSFGEPLVRYAQILMSADHSGCRQHRSPDVGTISLRCTPVITIAASTVLGMGSWWRWLRVLAVAFVLGGLVACSGGDTEPAADMAPRTTRTSGTTVAPLACPTGGIVFTHDPMTYGPGPGGGEVQSWAVKATGKVMNNGNARVLLFLSAEVVSTTGLRSRVPVLTYDEAGNPASELEPGERAVWSVVGDAVLYMRYGEPSNDEPERVELDGQRSLWVADPKCGPPPAEGL